MADEKLDTKIIPELKLKMKENPKPIYLRSMIIHHGNSGGGHYTCIYECKGRWYEYNDLNTNITLIGSFNNVCNMNNEYNLKNCTDLIYI
jgi:ubiquitin C-terminal hydrolase